MTKVHTRLLSLAGLLASATLATACFTPADFGADVAAEGHGDPVEHEAEQHAEVADEEKIIEGIQPGTTGAKLEIKAPEIPYDPPFDGEPLSTKTLDEGVTIEEFVLGDGEAVAEGKLVEFNFKGYASANGRQVMGSRVAPAKMAINESTRKRDPIASAMCDAMLGMKVGGKRRVKIPSTIVDKDAPPGRPPVGDLYMTVEVVGLADAPVLAGQEAYAGEPVSSKKLDNGLEIYDFAPGEGREAKAGDQVITHYIGLLTDGTEFDSSHGRAEGLPVVLGGGGVIPGFSQGLEGARVGMRRKIVVPPELGYGEADRGKIPPNSTLVFLLEIMEVKDGPQMPGMPGGATPPPRPRPKPTNDKPAGDEPDQN